MDKVEKDLDLELDPRKAYSFLCIGSTRSGKSTLIERLVNDYTQNKINILMTESPHADAYEGEGYRKHCILCPKYEGSLIKMASKLNKGTNNHYPINFILDDVVSAKNSTQLKALLTVMRNQGIGCIISAQGIKMLPPIARSNVNVVFLGRCNNDFEAEAIIKSFLMSYFPTDMKMTDKIKEYREITKNHTFICLNNLTDEKSLIKLKI